MMVFLVTDFDLGNRQDIGAKGNLTRKPSSATPVWVFGKEKDGKSESGARKSSRTSWQRNGLPWSACPASPRILA